MTSTYAPAILVGGAVVTAAILVVASGHASRPIVRPARVDGVTVYKPITLPVESPTASDSSRRGMIARAGAVQREHAFGIVEPLRTHSHTFQIRNTGSAPLKLKRSGTTCKCLDIAVIDATVAPQEVGRVRLDWHAKPSQDVFWQRGTIATNDPTQPTIDFVVRGRTKLILAAEPSEMTTTPLNPGESATLESRVISQVWDSFTIEDVRISLPGATWSTSPAEPEFLAAHQAKSGWTLSVTLPADMPSGPFRGSLQLVARPAAVVTGADRAGDVPSEPLEREIPIEGRVQGRISVYGNGVQPSGAIRMGSIAQDAGYEGRYVVKVNDPEPQLELVRVISNPSFVGVKLMPHPSIKRPGIYQLLVRIPPESAVGAYQRDAKGRLSLLFSHPRVKSLDVDLEFIVGPPEHDRLKKIAHR